MSARITRAMLGPACQKQWDAAMKKSGIKKQQKPWERVKDFHPRVLSSAYSAAGDKHRFCEVVYNNWRAESFANVRLHWAPKSVRVAAERMEICAQFNLYRPIQTPCRITLTRYGPRELDDDNLRSSFKAVRDALADWLGVNDRSKQLQWDYQQEKTKLGEYRIKILVEAI
ncbi:MAG: hypothetical protein ACP5I8_15845 [Phycisphaerae bacterium]